MPEPPTSQWQIVTLGTVSQHDPGARSELKRRGGTPHLGWRRKLRRANEWNMPGPFDQYAEKVRMAFGTGSEPISVVARRAETLFADVPIIVWEGDAQTFEFSFVSSAAEKVLGHPRERWTGEATFWADHVVHPADRDDAIAYCALATGKGRDHAFEYRANAADGRTVTLVDYVQVITGKRGIAERLRGIMIEVGPTPNQSRAVAWQSPSRQVLESDSGAR